MSMYQRLIVLISAFTVVLLVASGIFTWRMTQAVSEHGEQRASEVQHRQVLTHFDRWLDLRQWEAQAMVIARQLQLAPDESVPGEVIARLQLSVVCRFSTSRQLTWCRSADAPNREPPTIAALFTDPATTLRRTIEVSRASAGFIPTPAGALAIAVFPNGLMAKDDSFNGGFLLGRLIAFDTHDSPTPSHTIVSSTEKGFAEAAHLLQLRDDRQLPFGRADDSVRFRDLYYDPAGQPAIIVETNVPIEAQEITINYWIQLAITILVLVTIGILFVLVTFRNTISEPMRAIVEQISTNRLEELGDSLAISARRVDEIGILARALIDVATRHTETLASLRPLAAAVDSAGDGILLLNAQGRIQYVNQAYANMRQMQATDIVGRTPTELGWGADDLAVYEEIWNTTRAGGIWQGLLTIRKPMDQTTIEQTTVAPVFENDHIVGSAITVRDVTDQRSQLALQRRLATAVEESGDVVEILDINRRIEWVNQAWGTEMCYPAEKAIGRCSDELITYSPDDPDYCDLLETTSAGSPWHGMLRGTDVNGADTWWGMHVMPVREGPDESVSGYVVVKRNITERIVLERQLSQSQKLEAIGQLAAGIAHEINTPTQYVGDNLRFVAESFYEVNTLLQQLQIWSHAEDDGPSGDQIRAALKVADAEYLRNEVPTALAQSLEGIERVANIVRAMKEFSHPVQEKTPTDLNRAISSTVTVASNEWKYVAEVQTDFDSNLPLVPCLPGEFNQVMLNLIVNAAHAIGAGDKQDGSRNGEINIQTRLVDNDVEIRVSDNGCGIPEEVQQRIFEPFFTTKEVGRGTGQGLSIAYRVIVDEHGGTIRVESQPGQGTCFIVRLPLADTAGEAAAA